jgi:tetratricopeptide (TPR) repeat protein
VEQGGKLSKVNTIRKKALDHVRKQNWESAIKEYNRLAELDQSNPNVFNELGDIYLKTGNKSDAYDAFTKAIDAYARVSLHNNAVAECKKVLRLIPTRIEILTKLGLIRKKQGLGKEAESYYMSYLDKLITDQNVGSDDLCKLSSDIVSEMDDSFTVLEKLYDCMVKFNMKEESANVLQQLHKIYESQGMNAEKGQTSARLQELGLAPAEMEPPVEKEGSIITEENIWSAQAHTDGERIDITSQPGQSRGEPAEAVAASAGAPAGQPAAANKGNEFNDVEIGAGCPEPHTSTSTQTMTEPEPSPVQEPAPATAEPASAEASAEAPAEVSAEAPAEAPPEASPETPPGFPAEAWDSAPSRAGEREKKDEVKVSAIIDNLASETDQEVSDDDYRSHYDLGMAYLEMDLLSEAIREYQFAAKSPQYQARSLEMIGHCFLKQNQAGLAIKQLTKGLMLVGNDNIEALGIKYNLGLAYEMAGDFEKAKNAFEDVYVEDVTFRDVADKMSKYT